LMALYCRMSGVEASEVTLVARRKFS
jgi:hypothetical protein